MSPQWEEAWRSFQIEHYEQAASSIRNRKASVYALAWHLADPENGAITDPAQYRYHSCSKNPMMNS